MAKKDSYDRLLGIALGILGLILITIWIASSLDFITGIESSVLDLFLPVGICLIFLGVLLLSLIK
ncbi:hypothetical protein [Methanoregula sp.]|jgi:hypothetical protein|uniref:hypothetical protein n=1 Tax=Methanoregula sp. TaxID=2052170 RepID=UPI003C77DFBA